MSTKSRSMPPCKRSAALVLTLEFQGLSLLNQRGFEATTPRRFRQRSGSLFIRDYPVLEEGEKGARAGYLGSTREPLASF